MQADKMRNAKHRIAGVLISILIQAGPFVARASAELTLVMDGKPNAAIVVAPEPAPAISSDPKAKAAAPVKSKWLVAAEAIQTYIEKMSGAKLPLIEEGQSIESQPAVTILVGDTKAARKLGVEIPGGFNPAIRPDYGEEEGFVLKTQGNALVVAGNNDGSYQGTIYAAYALLEELGCRWYFPGEWGEIVPKRTTVTVPDLDVISRPDFVRRGIWLSGWVPITKEERVAYAQWGSKIRFSTGSFYPTVGDGFLSGLLPPGDYLDSHPEYYAMNQAGKRVAGKASHTMLCLSNPDVFAESVENLKRAFAGEKKMRIVTPGGFGISPPDGQPYCYCRDCKAASQGFSYPNMGRLTTQSEEFFAFAAKLAREFPDKWVATMAYSRRELPPQGVTIPPNVVVTYAPITSDVIHPLDTHLWRRSETLSTLRQWCQLSQHVMLYDYNPGFLLGMWVPERDTANLAVNMPIYKELGLKGFNREGRKAFMQTWISYYVFAKLAWDAASDVAGIKKDFYATFFGPAAGPHVQAWWDACEQVLLESPMQAHEDWLINHIYTVDFVKGIQRYVEAARTAKMDDVQRGRFAAFDLIAQHLAAYAEMNEAVRNLDYVAAGKACDRMTGCKDQLNAIHSFLITVDRARKRPYFAEGHKLLFEKLAAMTDGTAGTLVAPLPLEMKFARDRFNEGVIGEWYLSGYDDSEWGVKDTFLTWDQQDPPEDDKGHDYDGYGWYRATIEIDRKFAGRPIRLYLGGVLNEGWIWVNGRYAGHKTHKGWAVGQHEANLDITGLVEPGRTNVLAIRVWNSGEIGGLYRRGFLYAPQASAE